jgi:hypothetical protein
MESRRLSGFGLLAALGLLASAATAQVVQRPTPPPLVTAADAPWRLHGDPIFYARGFYDPSGPTVFFDGNVMVRSGEYEGVPLYVDPTATVYDVVYLPLSSTLMQPYQRRPEGETAPPLPPAPEPALELERSAGVTNLTPGPATPSVVVPPRAPRVETIPRPAANAGIWVRYDGARWRSAGRAVSYSPDEFVRIGEYRGAPVYRAKNGPAGRIYIPVVSGGPLAPFRKG